LEPVLFALLIVATVGVMALYWLRSGPGPPPPIPPVRYPEDSFSLAVDRRLPHYEIESPEPLRLTDEELALVAELRAAWYTLDLIEPSVDILDLLEPPIRIRYDRPPSEN